MDDGVNGRHLKWPDLDKDLKPIRAIQHHGDNQTDRNRKTIRTALNFGT